MSKLSVEEEVRAQGIPCILDLPEINQIWRDADVPCQLAIVARRPFRRSDIQIFLTEPAPTSAKRRSKKAVPRPEGPKRKPGRPKGSRTRRGFDWPRHTPEEASRKMDALLKKIGGKRENIGGGMEAIEIPTGRDGDLGSLFEALLLACDMGPDY